MAFTPCVRVGDVLPREGTPWALTWGKWPTRGPALPTTPPRVGRRSSRPCSRAGSTQRGVYRQGTTRATLGKPAQLVVVPAGGDHDGNRSLPPQERVRPVAYQVAGRPGPSTFGHL